MARNYKKEREWELKKYDRIQVKIDKELGMQLREKLKTNNKNMANWITENAKKYLKEK